MVLYRIRSAYNIVCYSVRNHNHDSGSDFIEIIRLLATFVFDIMSIIMVYLSQTVYNINKGMFAFFLIIYFLTSTIR